MRVLNLAQNHRNTSGSLAACVGQLDVDNTPVLKGADPATQALGLQPSNQRQHARHMVGGPWLVGGAVLLGTQSIIFVSTVAVFGKATSANIVYSSRGLLSVALVWMIGHWFMNAEQHLGPKVMRWRLAGALLMMSAIVLVVV